MDDSHGAPPVGGVPRAAVLSPAGLRPGSSVAGLRAPAGRGSLCPAVADPMAAAAMPPPPPRPPAAKGRGASTVRGGKSSSASTVRGAKATASTGRGAKATASTGRGGKGADSTGRGGKTTSARGGKTPSARGGKTTSTSSIPDGGNGAVDADWTEGLAAEVDVDDGAAATQNSSSGQVPAHIEFQAVLESQGQSNNDGLELLDDLSQSEEGFTGLMHDAIGLDDFTQPVDAKEEEMEEDVVEVLKGRGGNYSVAEDEALVSAWENITTDRVTGKDQPGGTYWQCVADYFHANCKVPTYRSVGSISHRWKSIQECCTRSSGCVENVDRQQPSGMTIEDRQGVTQELYKQRDPSGRGFAMLHCWQMLKHNEKWINRDKDSHPLKKRASSELEFDDYVDDDDESGRSTTPSSDWPVNKRPPGRKVSKERMKRGGGGGGGGEGDVFQSAVQDIIVSKKELAASRKEDKHAKMEADNQWREYIKSVEERKMAIEQERLRVQEEEAIARKEEASARREEAIAKKMKQKMKIMFMDISGLDDQQKAWVLATRGDMARKAQRASSESDNGNDGMPDSAGHARLAYFTSAARTPHGHRLTNSIVRQARGGDTDPDLEKGESPTAGATSTASLADEDRHDLPCSCGSDGPDYSCRRHYTCGLRNDVFYGMVLVSLLFAALAAFLLRRNPAPAAAAEGDTADYKLPNTSSVVWKVSLIPCSYLYFWILALSRTTGAATAFFSRVSYGALLAFAGGALVGPQAGVTVAHLTTAWAAGMAGHALAEHRLHAGFERAADEAAALTPATQSEDDRIGVSYSVFLSSLVTLGLAAGVAWLGFFPTFSDEDGPFMVMVLSSLVWVGLHLWACLANAFLLRDALVSGEFMERLYFYYMASFIPGLVFFAVSTWLCVYCFGAEMMAMAAFLGYILAVNAHRMEILAREKRESPGHHGEEDKEPASAVELEVEPGDHGEEDKEPASAAST
ncbi:hypothetical protein EJB05_28702, partial [Eragrostis curvula]